MKRHVTGAFVLCVGLGAGPAWAQSVLGPLDHCDQGDVEPNKHANYQIGGKLERPNEVMSLCQFRTFYEGNDGICFCEHDAFMAGTMWSEPKFSVRYGYNAWAFVDLLEMVTGTGDASAPYAEPFETPVHSFSGVQCIDNDGDGRCEGFFKVQLVQKQAGLIFKGLPPGNYWVSLDGSHPAEAQGFTFLQGFQYGNPLLTNFRVLPHEVAHDLGRPTDYGGSVACPQETACDDGIDNEGDGFADCGDLNCTYSEPCTETGAECLDGDDNDDDGLTDCEEVDCLFDPDSDCLLPWRVPDVVVEAENFNLGGPEVAYHDADPSNNGEAYRDEQVDIVQGFDGVLRVGWTVNGEWLAYDIDVLTTATYHLTARVSSGCGADCPGQNVLAASIDGVQVATFTFDDTGAWDTFVDVPGLANGSPDIPLTAGPHVLRLEVVNQGFDVDYVDFALPD